MSTAICFDCQPECREDEEFQFDVSQEADCILDRQSVRLLDVHRNLNELRQSGLLCDGQVWVGKTVFPVHKALLAAESPYFR